MTPSERTEITREVLALRERIERLEARRGAADSQYLAGALPDKFLRFFDGTWVDEAAPTTARYDAAATYYGIGHNDASGQDDGVRFLGDGYDREVYLRLKNPVRVRGRAVVLVVYFSRFWGEVSGSESVPLEYAASLRAGLVTAAFSQAALEAMTWNNKLSVAGDLHDLGVLSTQGAAVEEWLPLEWGGHAPGETDGVAVTARVPDVDATVTGIKLLAALASGDCARARVLAAKQGLAVPGRALLMVE